jgi:ABC-type bacteriocin/lantibiotic exporter with double-glycine peptidase domain
MRNIILLLLVLFLTGCTALPPKDLSTESHLIKMDFVGHRRFYCGPAALEVVFRYYDLEETQFQIAKTVYRPAIAGTLKNDMVKYAKQKGFDVKAGTSDLGKLKKLIDTDTPAIAFISLGPQFLWRAHYIVVLGYDDVEKVVIAHTGFRGYEKISYKKFGKRWLHNWIMFMKPTETTSPPPPEAPRQSSH